MTRPTIAIDIDDVLAATTPCLLEHVSKKLQIAMKPGDITRESYWLEYGISDNEAIKLVHDYNLHGFPDLMLVEGAQEAVTRLARAFRLVIITSRDETVAPSTAAWLEEHFPRTFTDIVHVGNKYVSAKVLSKAEVCKKLGARVAIDDDLRYINEYAAEGVDGLLFGDYPWRTYDKLPALVTRCKDWKEVEAYFVRATEPSI